MQKLILILFILALISVPVYASDIEPGEIPGNTEETYPADLPAVFSLPDFSVVVQPSSRAVSINNVAHFTVVAVGENLSYAWQYSINGGVSWFRSTSSTQGYNTPTLSVVGNASRNGFMYRCLVSNDSGSIITDAATLTVVTDGSSVPDWSPSDVLLLPVNAVVAAGNWFNSILTASGMTNFYITMIVIFLVVGILIVPIIGNGLGGLSDSVRKGSRKSDSDAYRHSSSSTTTSSRGND